MSTPSYQMGSVIELVANWTSDGTTAVNPTSVSLVYQKPDKTVVSVAAGDPSITNPATGQYIYHLTLDQTGEYDYRWTGASGALVALVLAGRLISLRDPLF